MIGGVWNEINDPFRYANSNAVLRDIERVDALSIFGEVRCTVVNTIGDSIADEITRGS